MSRKEVPRAGLLKAALAGRISNAQGAQALELSVRQFQRLKGRYRAEGAAGLVHRLRGRPAARRLAVELRRAVTTLLEGTYAGVNDCHVTEKLREVEGLMVSRSSVRRLRRAVGLPAKRQRRARRARQRREPAAQMGALVQVDASEYAWFESRGPKLTLHGAIDDATGAILALQLRPHEDLHGYVALLHELLTTAGVPLALYGDRLNVFVRNDRHWSLAEQLQGVREPTHFGRLLRDLGIGFIAARSPQAKGRVERLWQTLQDRLVSELRLRAITTVEAAQAFLPAFRADYNRRFTRVPAEATAAWRPAPRALAALLSCRYLRVVAHDNTVRLGPRWAQLPRGRVYTGRRVEVRECLDGQLRVFADGACIVTKPAPPGAFVLRPRHGPSADRRLRRRAAERPTTAGGRYPSTDPHGPKATSSRSRPAPRRPTRPAPRRPSRTHPWRHNETFAIRNPGMTFPRNS